MKKSNRYSGKIYWEKHEWDIFMMFFWQGQGTQGIPTLNFSHY